jgi:tetratricopeptide (TPR) repeat protein
MLNRPNHIAAIFAGLLLCTGSGVRADDYQDAGALFKQGQYNQAMEKVNGYLAQKPEDAKARFLKGLIATKQGNVSDAINIFQALTVDYPELPEPYNNLAVLYASQAQYDKAKVALERAIRTHPSYATAHENLGDIYAKMASQAYDRALQLDRGNTTTQTKLAMIQDLFAGGAIGKATSPLSPAAEKENKTEAAAPAAMRLSPVEKSAEPAVDDNSEILETVKSWATAWSSRNVDGYLSFYAEDFNTPGGESRAAWSAARKERISAPKSIHVDISNIIVKFNDNSHATVKFRQSYSSNQLRTSGHKTLLMVKSGDKWLIQEERAK